MTDIRARLVGALREHGALDDEDWQKCECGAPTPWADHLADVLLSLPGIAIVELPERNAKGEWPCCCDGRHVWLDQSGLYVRTLGETFVHNPRGFAAALLAAADAADGQTTP